MSIPEMIQSLTMAAVREAAFFKKFGRELPSCRFESCASLPSHSKNRFMEWFIRGCFRFGINLYTDQGIVCVVYWKTFAKHLSGVNLKNVKDVYLLSRQIRDTRTFFDDLDYFLRVGEVSAISAFIFSFVGVEQTFFVLDVEVAVDTKVENDEDIINLLKKPEAVMIQVVDIFFDFVWVSYMNLNRTWVFIRILSRPFQERKCIFKKLLWTSFDSSDHCSIERSRPNLKSTF